MSSDPSPTSRETEGLLRSFLSFLRAQTLFTLLPGLVCASPFIFMGLAASVPAFGVLGLLAIIPALAVAVYFIPALMLLRSFFEYQPDTLKGGSLLPLPAQSPTDWAKLLTAQAIIVAAIWLLPTTLNLMNGASKRYVKPHRGGRVIGAARSSGRERSRATR